MAGERKDERTARCLCGEVTLSAIGAPILSTVCYCTSCREAGRALEALPGAPPLVEDDGGTSMLLFRKDRVACRAGTERPREHRLKPESKTRRVVSACCNTPMFLEFTNGHWLSLYAARFPTAARPPLEMRVMTRDRIDQKPFPDGVPAYATHSGLFMIKLLAAWLAMGLRTPKIDDVKGEIDAAGVRKDRD